MLGKDTKRHLVVVIIIILLLLLLFAFVCHGQEHGMVREVVNGHEAMSDQFFLPIYIINLERSHERKKYMEERITQDVVSPPRYSVTFVKGVDGKNSLEMFYEPLQNRGHMGLWKSWVNVFQIIERENHPFALVLEDDADAQMPERFDDIKAVVEDVYAQCSRWHILFLGGHVVEPDKLDGSTTTVKRCNNCTIWGTEAVLVSRAGAQRILADPIVISEIINNDKLAEAQNLKNIDNYLSESNLDVFVVVPPLVNQNRSFNSTVLTGEVF
jgi:GR25 family glycosyltransferase involved in LPS biosynthesis